MIAEYMFNGFEGELKDLNGPFGNSGNENHGKPVYAKIGTNQGHKVMMYYWDQRDGDELHGWWIAPEVGGAHVWAMNPIGSTTPPQSGWKVPWHGRVNTRVTCMPQNKRGSSSKQSAAKKAREEPSATPDETKPAEIRRAEFEQRTEREQVKFFEERLKTLQSQAKNLADQAKKKLADVKENPHFRTLLTDKEEKKLSSEELKKRTDELERILTTIIRQIQTSKLATSNKIIEGEAVLREAKFPVPIWPAVKTKLTKYIKVCEDVLQEATEWKTRKEDKEAVLWTKAADTLVDELDVVLQKAEKNVEKLKDAATLLTADVTQHLSMKELEVASDATELAIAHATKSVQQASLAITEKIPLFKNASPAAFQKFRVLQLKIPMWNEDIQKIQKLSLEADKKGREILAAEERNKSERKAKEKEKRFERWNQNMIDDGWAEVYVVEDMLEAAEQETNKPNVQRAREAMLALEKTVEDFIMKKDASNKTREILATTMGNKVRDLRTRVTECQKRISEAEFDEIQDKLMHFAGRVMAYMQENDLTEKQIFETLSKGGSIVTVVQITAWGTMELQAKKEEVACAIERADCLRPATKNALSLEEFPLLFRVYFEACEGATLIANIKADDDDDDEEEEQSVIEVPEGTLVMLCGLPNKNIIPVKAVHGEGSGFLNAEEPGWARVSPYYECVSETVLTDAYQMTTSFQLVKRVKVGERLRIIEPPKVDDETGVTRMKAQSLTDGKIGWCTIAKPGGPEYMTADSLTKDASGTDEVLISADPTALEGVHCVEGEPIEALRDGDWTLCHLGKCMGASAFVEVIWSDDTKGRVGRKDIRCRGTATKVRLSQWSLADFVGRIIKKAYDELKRVTVPEMKVTDEKGQLLAPDAIRAMGYTLEKEALHGARILDEMTDYLKEKAQDPALKEHLTRDLSDVAKRHNKLMSKLNEFRHGTAMAIQSEISKARAAEVAREYAIRKQKEKELQDRSDAILAKGAELIEAVHALCDAPPPQTAALNDLIAHRTALDKAEKEAVAYFDTELEAARKLDSANTLVHNLLNMQRKSRRANNDKIAKACKDVCARLDAEHTKAQGTALTEVRGYITKAYPNMSMQDAVRRLFDRICVDADDPAEEDDDSSSSSSSEGPPQIKVVELKRFERELFSMSPKTLGVIRSLPWPLNREQFVLTFVKLARVIGSDSVKVTNHVTGVVACTVEPHDVIEVVKEPQGEEDLVKVCLFSSDADGERKREGHVANKRIRMLGLKYEISKETVLTNKAELTQLKVLSRLKKGEKVLAISLPIVASKLLRMRAKLEDGTVGWLSMVGNNVDFVIPTSWV